MPDLMDKMMGISKDGQFDLIDLFDVGMTVFDTNLEVLHINEKAISLLDLPEELTRPGTALRDIIEFNHKRGEYGQNCAPDIVDQRLSHYQSNERYEYIRQRPNGTILKVVSQPTYEGGHATTYTDITLLEKSRILLQDQNSSLQEELGEKQLILKLEQELIEREAAINNIVLENTHHGISLFDKDLTLILCNKRFRELLRFPDHLNRPGTTMEEMLRYNAERGEYGEVDVETCVAEKLALARKFEPHSFHRTLSDGRVLEVVGRPVSIGFVSTYTDVTEIARARQQLEEAFDKQKALLEASPAGMGITRIRDGRIQLINSPGAKLLGFDTPDAAIGFVTRDVCWITPEDRDHFLNEFNKHGSVKAKEVHLRKVTGEDFWCYLSWDQISHEGEDSILFWMYDISEQRETYRKLLESEKMASLGGLVAGVAHEINTPIGVGITAISQLRESVDHCQKELAQEKLTKGNLTKFLENSREAFDIVFANLQTAAQLVQSFKQVSVDQVTEVPREIRLSEYIGQVVRSLKPETKRAGVRVEVSCLHDDILFTYPGALSQILTNLVQNAIIHGFEHRDHGHIEISYSGSQEMGIDLMFRDNGQGTEEKNLKKLLEPFYTTKRGSGGSGLGLNVVHNLVTHKLRGELILSRPKGGGLQFDIHLPVMSGREGEQAND